MSDFFNKAIVTLTTIALFSCSSLKKEESNSIRFDVKFNTANRFKGIIEEHGNTQFFFIKNYDTLKISFFDLKGQLRDSIVSNEPFSFSKNNFILLSKDRIIIPSNETRSFGFLNKEGVIYKEIDFNDLLEDYKTYNYGIYPNTQHSIVHLDENNLFFNIINNFNNSVKDSLGDFKKFRILQSQSPQLISVQNLFKPDSKIKIKFGMEGVFHKKDKLEEQIVFPLQHKFLSIALDKNIAFSSHDNTIYFFNQNLDLYKEIKILDTSIYEGNLEFIENIIHDPHSNRYAVILNKTNNLSEHFGLFEAPIISSRILIFDTEFNLLKSIPIDIDKYDQSVVFFNNNKLYIEIYTVDYGKVEYKIITP